MRVFPLDKLVSGAAFSAASIFSPQCGQTICSSDSELRMAISRRISIKILLLRLISIVGCLKLKVPSDLFYAVTTNL